MMRAVAALVAVLSIVAGASVPPAQGAVQEAGSATLATRKPPIVWKPIPFGDRRKSEMAGYSKRHYGQHTWRLRAPKVIVEHYTAGTSFSSAWNTFAADSRHNGELPGTCAHFIIDRDGTIYQLVRLRIRCRHAVGMNYTAIGIEHVGTSDHMVLSDWAQMHASLRLTLWLMQRFGINIGNVIGHRESLESPYRFELYRSWRCLVHADFPHWAMQKYRHRLRDLASRRGVPVGKGPVWENVYGC
jgi:N-acetyl-anhydromuramyl-L-alanine amidase AmpD